MCGIYGYYDVARQPMAPDTLESMAASVSHRGPDSSGVAHLVANATAIGCERLKIIDPVGGDQPFVSDNHQVAVVQNGAIFNYRELASELALGGQPCRTGSDTEVLLHQYERHGIDFVESLNGMYAIAIHDRAQDCLYLVRDRVGEKPLFYSYVDGRCVFGSEIKTILAARGVQPMSLTSLSSFLRFNYVPPPATMYDDISHVMPGHWVRIDRQGVSTHRYWDAAENEAIEQPVSSWLEQFSEIIDDAVRLRLRADVPFGAYLSGGVDSSTVVGLMSNELEDPVNTFSIGFTDPRFDESTYAQQAAARFRTNHRCEIVEPDVVASWPRVMHHCDQPHGDASFLPTLRLAELAAQHVRVVLTGDGADELFAGYDGYKRYFSTSDARVDRTYLEHISVFNSASLASVLGNTQPPESLGDEHHDQVLAPLLRRVDHFDEVTKALYLDVSLLLPGNNLVKPDRLGMAVAIENRSPFLDHRMVELAFAMPGSLKLREGVTKYIQKRAVAPLIGDELAYRKKQMFTVPIGEWFKDTLYQKARRSLLGDDATTKQLFNQQEVERMLGEHHNATSNYTRELRALLAVELWLREQQGSDNVWAAAT